MLQTFLFVLGTIFGSFFNVCIYRLPKDIGLNKNSSCTSCKKKINYYHNIPIPAANFPWEAMKHNYFRCLRDSLQKSKGTQWSPKWTQQSLKCGVYVHYFFATHLDPYFNDLVSHMIPKMVPKKLPFLRPLTLLKYSK